MIEESKLNSALQFLDTCPEAEDIMARGVESGTLLEFSRRFRALGVEPVGAVEIGTFRGRSTYFLSQMVSPEIVYTIEALRENYDYACWFLGRHTTNTKIYFGDSVDVLPRLLQHAVYNIAFIDGLHNCTRALPEYLMLERFIKRPGLIIFHDVSYVAAEGKVDGGVPRAVEMLGDLEIEGDKAYKVVT